MAYRDEVLADSPTLYWRLGETSGTTAADETSNAKTGTYNNSPTLGVTGGLVNDTNKAINCDGTNDSVTRDDTALRISTGSVEVWFQTTKSSSVTAQALAVMRSWFGLYVLNAKLQAYSFGAAAYRDTGITVNDGRWHHAVMTFNTSTNGTKIYLDGCLVLTTTLTAGTADNSAHFCCGAQNTPTANASPYTGDLDEVALYTTELSAKRVAVHYLAGRDRLMSYQGIVMDDLPDYYYRLGEASGTVATDIGVASLQQLASDGTYVNSPTLNQTGAIAGDSNKSVAFDGVNDYVDTNLSKGDGDIGGIGSSHSYELWFKQDVAPASGKAHRLVFWGNKTTYTPNGHQETVHVSGSTGGIVFQRYNNSQSQGPTYAYTKTNTWTHVVATYDAGDGKMRLYVDGHLRSTATPTNTITINDSAEILLGHDLGTPADIGLDGNLDEFAYYPLALLPEEISEHYAAAFAEIAATTHDVKGSISPTVAVNMKAGKVSGIQYSVTGTVTFMAPAIGLVPVRTSISAANTSTVSPVTMAATGALSVTAASSISSPVAKTSYVTMDDTATVTVLSPLMGFVPLRSSITASTTLGSQVVRDLFGGAVIESFSSVNAPAIRTAMALAGITAASSFTAYGWQPLPIGPERQVGTYFQQAPTGVRSRVEAGAIITVERQAPPQTTRERLGE